MVPFWFLSIIWHLVFRVPKGDHNFDNHPYSSIVIILVVVILIVATIMIVFSI